MSQVEDPVLEEPEAAIQSSKKRKADSLKDTPTAAPSHPSKKQAKTASDQPAPTSTAKQAKHKGDKAVAAAAAGATAGNKKSDKAAAAAAGGAAAVAAGGDGAPLSKSQLKKQRKKGVGNEDAAAAAAADTPGILLCFICHVLQQDTSCKSLANICFTKEQCLLGRTKRRSSSPVCPLDVCRCKFSGWSVLGTPALLPVSIESKSGQTAPVLRTKALPKLQAAALQHCF